MDAETVTISTIHRTISLAHRSSSLLIDDSGYTYTGTTGNEKVDGNEKRLSGSGHESWSSFKKFLSRRPSQKNYRTLERREPRRLRKKSLSVSVAS